MREGWEIRKLGEVCTLIMGQSPDSSTYNEQGEGMPFFQGCADFGSIHPTITTFCTSPKKVAEIEDVLMSVRAPIGTLNIANIRCCIGRGLAAIRQKEDVSTFKYLYYFISKSKKSLQGLGTGATFKAIGKDTLTNFPIPVPPVKEQEGIVAELDCLSEVIAKKKQQLEELDKLAQSVFNEMFGDPITNEKGWPVKLLGKVCDVRDGTHDSPKYVEHSDFILITSKNIVDGSIDFSNINYIKEEDYIAINKRSKVDDGDIIMAMIGTIGKPIIVRLDDYKFCIKNVALIKFFSPGEVSNIYVRALLDCSSYTNHIKSLNKGGAQKFIALGTIRNLPIPVPPLDLQDRFALKIEAIEQQKALVKQSIVETETLFNSRMDFWFK